MKQNSDKFEKQSPLNCKRPPALQHKEYKVQFLCAYWEYKYTVASSSGKYYTIRHWGNKREYSWDAHWQDNDQGHKARRLNCYARPLFIGEKLLFSEIRRQWTVQFIHLIVYKMIWAHTYTKSGKMVGATLPRSRCYFGTEGITSSSAFCWGWESFDGIHAQRHSTTSRYQDGGSPNTFVVWIRMERPAEPLNAVGCELFSSLSIGEPAELGTETLKDEPTVKHQHICNLLKVW